MAACARLNPDQQEVLEGMFKTIRRDSDTGDLPDSPPPVLVPKAAIRLTSPAKASSKQQPLQTQPQNPTKPKQREDEDSDEGWLWDSSWEECQRGDSSNDEEIDQETLPGPDLDGFQSDFDEGPKLKRGASWLPSSSSQIGGHS